MAAHTGRIFEFVHGSEEGPAVITPANLPPIVQMLQESIRDETHIAEKACCPTVNPITAETAEYRSLLFTM